MQLSLAWAFLVRDVRLSASYKTGFLLSIVGSLVQIVMLFFLSRLLEGATESTLAQYGGSYFGFVIVGVALTTFMALGMAGLSSKIRESQLMGTLELMVLSPSQFPLLLVFSSLWSHVYSASTIAIYLGTGLLLGMDFSQANLPVALLGLLLAVVSFNALGLLAASVVIIIKQGNPVNWVVSSASTLLAGVFYPTEVLPDGLRALGQILPLTHALEVIRQAVFNGADLGAVWPALLRLLVLTAVLMPAGIAACQLAVRVAQSDGSLSHY